MFSTFLLKQVNSFFLADEILVILCDFLNKVIIKKENIIMIIKKVYALKGMKSASQEDQCIIFVCFG